MLRNNVHKYNTEIYIGQFRINNRSAYTINNLLILEFEIPISSYRVGYKIKLRSNYYYSDFNGETIFETVIQDSGYYNISLAKSNIYDSGWDCSVVVNKRSITIEIANLNPNVCTDLDLYIENIDGYTRNTIDIVNAKLSSFDLATNTKYSTFPIGHMYIHNGVLKKIESYSGFNHISRMADIAAVKSLRIPKSINQICIQSTYVKPKENPNVSATTSGTVISTISHFGDVPSYNIWMRGLAAFTTPTTQLDYFPTTGHTSLGEYLNVAGVVEGYLIYDGEDKYYKYYHADLARNDNMIQIIGWSEKKHSISKYVFIGGDLNVA